MPKSEFYLRYYVGHKGKFGHEFLEFEFRPDGECIVYFPMPNIYDYNGGPLFHRQIAICEQFQLQKWHHDSKRGVSALYFAFYCAYSTWRFNFTQAYVHQCVLDELKRIIEDSEIMQEDDALWPPPDRVGRQELEIVMGDEHISFSTSKIGSLVDVNQSKYLN